MPPPAASPEHYYHHYSEESDSPAAPLPDLPYLSPRAPKPPLPPSPFAAPSPLLPYGLTSPNSILISPLASPASAAWSPPFTHASSYFPPFEPMPSGPPSPPPLETMPAPIPIPRPGPTTTTTTAHPPGLKITIPPHNDPVPEPSPVPESDPDMAMDDESLSALERIYLYSRSLAVFQRKVGPLSRLLSSVEIIAISTPTYRVYIVHALPKMLNDITPSEAVDYVLPLLNNLACDDDDQVQEALASELLSLVWWYITNCKLTPEEPPEGTSDPTLLCAGAFTPLFGTLLLSQNAATGLHARQATVDLLKRLHDAEGEEEEESTRGSLFGPVERQLFEQEILDQVVVAIGNLDTPHPPHPQSLPTSPFSDTDASTSRLNPNDFPPLTRQSNSTVQPRGSSFEPPSDRSLLVAVPPLSPPSVPRGVATGPPINPFAAPGMFDGQDGVQRDTQPLSDTGEDLSPSEERWADAGNREAGLDDEEYGEQAILGRISRMSLMATLTANGSIGEERHLSFLPDVESGGRDSNFWVRREAAFALGALAKVLPDELVLSLVPLCEALCQDTVWHVRHSAVFALPAVLSRISPSKRAHFARRTVLPLVTDESAAVRLGLLEVTGEVIYAFHDHSSGLPDEILRLFIGRPEDRVREPDEPHRWSGDAVAALKSPISINGYHLPPSLQRTPDPENEFYQHTERPLICAFNFPAVALSLGRARWKDLRELHQCLLGDPNPRVRRTLAASLGELAKIIGPEAAAADLLPAWLDAARYQEPQVRLKAAECLGTLIQELAPRGRTDLAEALNEIRRESFVGWREREMMVQSLVVVASSTTSTPTSAGVVRTLLREFLQDGAASVRTAAINALPMIILVYKDQPKIVNNITDDLTLLADPTSFRKRTTFISCLQSLAAQDNQAALNLVPTSLWDLLLPMAQDGIIDVRIRLTKFLVLLNGQEGIPLHVMTLLDQLREDPSPDIQLLIPAALQRVAKTISSGLPATVTPTGAGNLKRPTATGTQTPPTGATTTTTTTTTATRTAGVDSPQPLTKTRLKKNLFPKAQAQTSNMAKSDQQPDLAAAITDGMNSLELAPAR